jgi:membrane protein
VCDSMGQKRPVVEEASLQALNPLARTRRVTWKFPFHVLGRAASNFASDRGTLMAASISYFTLFALFPATLLAVSIFGFVLRDEAMQERVLNAIIGYLPVEGTAVAESLRQVASLGATATVVSLVAALWTSGALTAAVRQSLNQVFGVTQRRPLVRGKLIDFLLLPVIAVPLLGGIVLSGVWRFFQVEISENWGILDGEFAWTWEVGAFLIPLSMSFIAFTLLYRLAPNVKQPVRYIWPGALFAALAFEGLKMGFGFYLENVANYTIYGSLGSVIVLLFWVFVTANILIFGAEIASEIPHVLRDEPHPGDAEGEPADLKRSVLTFLRGLVMVPEQQVRPRYRQQDTGAAGDDRAAPDAEPAAIRADAEAERERSGVGD